MVVEWERMIAASVCDSGGMMAETANEEGMMMGYSNADGHYNDLIKRTRY